jgi:hypothetical protein
MALVSTHVGDDAVAAILTDQVRDAVRVLADEIIPAGDGFPSAAEAGVHGRYLDRALVVRPDVLEPLVALARECAAGDPATVVAQLAAAGDGRLEAVAEVIIACYFMSPKPRRRIDYPGQVASPILEGEDEYYLRDDILAPVVSRPPLWRATEEDLKTAT